MNLFNKGILILVFEFWPDKQL